MKKEIWKISCKNSRSIYEVSNFGNVRKNGKEFECKVISCVSVDGHKKEYKYFSSNHYVHREVYRLFIGEIPSDFVVHHNDEDSLNNHVENLQCMSNSDHIVLHATGHVVSEATRKKMSDTHTGHDVSESTRKKMSEAQTGEKNPRGMLNKHHSESTKKKISVANTGKIVLESTKKKISVANTGKIVSESTKKKMSKTKSGEKNPTAKLTSKDVEKIRELLSEGKLKQIEIAKMFNVTQSVISDIKRGKTWKVQNRTYFSLSDIRK